ncbi:MAG: hypothetical protein L0191_02085 [Acidobacteria bacterium]|nr:hypothetical protein [Acidobacteriota bacterium]
MGRVKGKGGTFLSNAAEHYVVAELLRRDVMATEAPRDAPSFDVLAAAGSRAVHIRVKARSEKKPHWIWRRRADGTVFGDLAAEGDFTVLVHLPGADEPARYWVVPTRRLARKVRWSFEEWRKTPGRGGRRRRPSNPVRLFGDKEEQWKWLEPFAGRWDLILAALSRGKQG